jgi:glycine/D-amino acid oxidase-like deaminating enzyme
MLGALYHPDDGHIAPADVTMAMAKAARDLGAKVGGCHGVGVLVVRFGLPDAQI